MKRILLVSLALVVLFWTKPAHAQNTQLDTLFVIDDVQIKLCLDPGHGGHDPENDRQIDLGLGTYYWESDANWEAVGYLDTLLQKLGADVKLTRTTNHPDSINRDPTLSDRVQVANNFGAEYFHSFHTNAFGNTANYTLVLYAGTDSSPEYPDAKVLG
ncbi:MAG: N-acetylmuramoyl-L-alanine amidase, partial [Bacteroidota bacterium]